ncbi:hypothetical protein, partial [Alcanivorax sp. HI0083]|uniref:hypothetical protein n=1 Tax=Alcanivorax sp. HI0083 TaxID=1822258 RepID=UPI001E3E7467
GRTEYAGIVSKKSFSRVSENVSFPAVFLAYSVSLTLCRTLDAECLTQNTRAERRSLFRPLF